MKQAFDRRRRTIVSDAQRDRRASVCPEPEGAFYAYPRSRGCSAARSTGARLDTSAELAECILDEAEVAVGAGRGVRRPGLPAALLRARRRRPGRGRHPAAEAVRLTPAGSGGRRGRRDDDAAQGAPAPALHRVDAARDAGRAGRAGRHRAARRAGRATGRRSCRRPTRRAGSGSSGSTTWPGRCCAPRTTYAGWCARPPRTTSRDGGRWLEIQVDPSGYAARFGGITAFTDLVLDAVREASAATGLGIAVVVAANRTRHPLDARTLARLAAQYAGRGVVGFGLSNDERRGDDRGLRAGLRDRRAGRAAAGPARRRAARPGSVRACLDALHADRLGHGVRVGGGPGAARPGRGARACRSRSARSPTSRSASTPT